MDPLTQLCQKLSSERTYQSIRPQQQQDTAPPPPYATSNAHEEDSDSDDFDSNDSLLTLTINAAHSIQGSNNLVPTSPIPLAEATKFSAVLLAAVNQLNRSIDVSPQRRLKVDLMINCGITVIGDRNVIGNVELKAKPTAAASEMLAAAEAGAASSSANSPAITAPVVAGAKRKAEDEDESSVDAPQAKRVAVAGSSATSTP